MNEGMRFCITFIIAMVVTASFCPAGLTFEKTLIEFHPKAGDAEVIADFAFRNDSDKSVRIAKYDAACSCMTVGVSGGKRDYAPGEVGVIRAVFRLTGYSGTMERVVALWLDGDPPEAPSAQLTVRAHIPQLIKMEPKTLSWDLNQAPQPQTITFEMDPEHKIHILGTQSSTDSFTLELKTIEAGRKYEVIVTPKSTETPGIAIFRVETDCKVESQRMQSAYGVIRNPPRKPQP